MGSSEIVASSWGCGAPFQETSRTILNLELLYILCHPSEILYLSLLPDSHLYAHCLFPSYFRKIFLPQWWKHITMKWAAMESLLTPLFRKEVTVFQDLFVLYILSPFSWSRDSFKLLSKPFPITRHFHQPQKYVLLFPFECNEITNYLLDQRLLTPALH